MFDQHEVQVGVAICTPIPNVRKANGVLAKADITVDWHRHRMGMLMPTNIITCDLVADGMEVGEARCKAVDLTMALSRRPEFLFFIDYDVLIPHDILVKLLARARHFPEYDIFAGVYCSKSDYPEPLVYMRDGDGPYWDWAVGDLLFDLASVHMGCTLIRTSLFERMAYSDENPLFYSTNKQEYDDDGLLNVTRGTEDIYFCRRAREEAGARIMADTSLLCAHQDIRTGTKYGLLPDTFPIQRAYWMWKRAGKSPPHEQLGLKKALEIGCGEYKRSWEGHFTYAMDIRKLPGIDFVQDARQINLPENDFDLVASSHFLEHIGRWEQEKVWAEMYKVLKPGGWMEHIVPNIMWARDHLNNQEMDVHVANVVYGAQEQHGYERNYNTHYWCYTPGTARAMCELFGLEDITITTYNEEPELYYNMVIRARKPLSTKRKKRESGVSEPTEELSPPPVLVTDEPASAASEPEVEAATVKSKLARKPRAKRTVKVPVKRGRKSK